MNVKVNLCTFIFFELLHQTLVYLGVVRSGFFLATHENSANANLPDRNLCQ